MRVGGPVPRPVEFSSALRTMLLLTVAVLEVGTTSAVMVTDGSLLQIDDVSISIKPPTKLVLLPRLLHGNGGCMVLLPAMSLGECILQVEGAERVHRHAFSAFFYTTDKRSMTMSSRSFRLWLGGVRPTGAGPCLSLLGWEITIEDRGRRQVPDAVSACRGFASIFPDNDGERCVHPRCSAVPSGGAIGGGRPRDVDGCGSTCSRQSIYVAVCRPFPPGGPCDPNSFHSWWATHVADYNTLHLRVLHASVHGTPPVGCRVAHALQPQLQVLMICSSTGQLLLRYCCDESAFPWVVGSSFFYSRRCHRYPSDANMFFPRCLCQPTLSHRFARPVHLGACVFDAPAYTPHLLIRPLWYLSGCCCLLFRSLDLYVSQFSFEDCSVIRLL